MTAPSRRGRSSPPPGGVPAGGRNSWTGPHGSGRRGLPGHLANGCRVALAALLVLAADAAAAEGARRFAIVAGNNEGGEGTRPLRYAERDAERVHDALLRLGGVAPADARLLAGGDAGDLAAALAATERQIAAAGGRAELFVYFSGHSRDDALRLGRTAFPLAALKERLAASGAAIRIAFLDACRSGAITRTKGARRAPAFDVDAGPRPATGLVILTSSSNDEDSQESDAITGSFFTHALVSGMLGDADASGDGRVSLAEAYAYAYGRTVEGTLETRAGPQHPTFSFDLAGQGDVILTRLDGAGAALVLPAALEGTFVVVEEDRRVVAAEVRKTAGAERRLALAPGPYLVKTRRADHLLVAPVTVPRRGEARLDPARLRAVPFTDDPVKGFVAEVLAPRKRWAIGAGAGLQTFLSAPTRELLFPAVPLFGLDLELRDYFRPGWILGADLAVGGASGTLALDGGDFAYEFAQAVTGLSLAWEPWPDARLRPRLGGRVAYVSMERRFPGHEAQLPPQRLATVAPGLVGGVTWDAVPPVSLFANARASYLVYEAEDDRSLGFLDFGAGVRVEF